MRYSCSLQEHMYCGKQEQRAERKVDECLETSQVYTHTFKN